MRLILHGGNGKFLGRTFDVLGLDGTAKDARARCRRASGCRRSSTSCTTHASRSPRPTTRCARPPSRSSSSRSPQRGPLGARLGAGAELRARADAHVPRARARRRCAGGGARRERARPARARPRPARPSWSPRRSRSPALVSAALGLAVALGFGVVIQSWATRRAASRGQRLPLLAVGPRAHRWRARALWARSSAALAREARTASLVAVLRRAADRLPRADPSRVLRGRRLGERRAAVRARRSVLLGGALRPPSLGQRRARGGVARRRSACSTAAVRVLAVRTLRGHELRSPSRGCAACAGRARCAISCARRRLSVDDLVMPLFVAPEALAERAPARAAARHRSTALVRECEELVALGVKSVILFGIPEAKDDEGSRRVDRRRDRAAGAARAAAALPGARAAHRRLPLRVHEPRPLRRGRRRRRGRQRRVARADRAHRRLARRGGRRRRLPERHDGRPRRRGSRRSCRRRRSSRTRRSTPRRSTGRSATSPTARPRSATAAATSWTRATCARRSASASSTSPRAPTC